MTASRDEQIADYLDAGLALVPIPAGKKGPTAKGWNLPENCIRTPDQAVRLNGSSNLGLAHAYCDRPTCAIDVDDMAKAKPWLKERGVDINALLAASDAVRIDSGRPGRAKLLFHLPEAMPSCVVAGGGLELRCTSKGGLTVQDVLPPSVHPDTGKPYLLIGDIANIPPIPDALLRVWRQALAERPNGKQCSIAPPEGRLPKRFVELLDSDDKLRRRWDGNSDGLDDTSRSAMDMSLTSLLVKRGFNDVEITAILRAFVHGKVAQDGREGDYIGTMLAKVRRDRTLSRTNPMPNARRFIAERFSAQDGTSLLLHWRGDFYTWCDGAYRPLQQNDVEAAVYAYLEGAHCMTKKGREPFAPNRAKVGDIQGALRATAHLQSHNAPPCWLYGATSDDDPDDLLAVENGMLHMPTRTLRAHDPRLFTTTALPFSFDPNTGPPKAWLAFLHGLWGDDAESIETLQEFFGYVLTSDSSRQKILAVVGPRRGGKGTIARVLRGMLGEENHAGPTLDSIGTNFGLQPLIGKRLAIISDARLGSRADQQKLAERLLSISGEDALTIDRKYAEPWTGTLGVRFLLLTNELPRITDASGALASRFIILQLTRSWLGQEDLGLADRLTAELPAILNWSLDGLERLAARGQFRQPATAQELVRELEDLGSPIGAFLRECCVVEPGAQVGRQQLFMTWRLWCSSHGRDHAGTEATFGRDLRAAVPELRTARLGADGDRRRVYEGVRLRNSVDKASLL